MLLLYTLLFLPAFVTAETTQPTMMQESMEIQVDRLKSDLDQVNQGISSFFDAMTSISRSNLEGRKKKYKLNKYLLPLIVGFIMIKSILLPIALKALAVLSGKAVVLSLMSLILAAIVGLKKVAQSSPGSNYDVVAPSKYRRQDLYEFPDDAPQNEPYKYYKEQRRKK